MTLISIKRFLMQQRWLVVALLLISSAGAYICWPISPRYLANQSVTSTHILDSKGELLREMRPEGRGIPVQIEKINPFVVKAVVAIEDRHFYDHFGVNPVSILRAMQDNLAAGAVVRGGSTITMQVARTLRSNARDDLRRTLYQKIAEAFLALRLEAHLSKEEILNLWLNNVYFGNQAYGIEAASRLYFRKSAVDLSRAESAFLAGLPQRPNGFDPFKFMDDAVQRQHRVLEAMFQAGHLSAEEVATLKQIKLLVTPAASVFKAPHFVEYVKKNLPDKTLQPAVINTTLYLPLQQKIEALAGAHLQRLGNNRATNVAVVVIENQTGNLLAYVGSADFWNVAIEGQNDGVLMLRQPGSTLKPFTYALALSSYRYSPASILPDIEIHVPEAGGAFSPLNYDKKFHGPVSLRTALASSYNVPAVRIMRTFGPASLINLLHAAGVRSLNKNPDHYGVGLTLGNGEVQLIELTQAYAALAQKGKVVPLHTIQSIVTTAGDTLTMPASEDAPAFIDPAVAYLITDILQDPEARAPAFGRHGPLELPFPVAVKTGTSKDYRDNWSVGYTPTHTVGVWVGNFDGAPMRRVSGVSGAGPLFHAIMLELGAGGSFEKPPGVENAMICPVSGKQPGKNCPGVKKELFLTGTVPADTCDVHKVFDIDIRTGLLASEGTPAVHVHPTLFTVYPDIYTPWAKAHGIPQPPATFNGTASTHFAVLPDAGADDPKLVITYPNAGATFQMDPVLLPSFQKIKLQGTAQPGMSNPGWWVNGHPVEGAVHGAFWPLQEGVHQIELRAEDGTGGTVKSSPVNIRVLPDQISSTGESITPLVTTSR